MASVFLYWHTIRYLRPIQIWGRIWRRIDKPRLSNLPPPSVRKGAFKWHSCQKRATQIGPKSFKLLNQERELQKPADWNSSSVDKLWLYNVHYFDDLNAENFTDKTKWHNDLIDAWINENPPATGNGWEPYCISLRVVNWIKWAWSGNELSARTLDSLATQIRHLRQTLETHLLGNHLWANIKALIFASVFFEGAESNIWMQQAIRLWRRELKEQILLDGGHFERSPMYHAILYEDILDVIQVANLFPNLFEENDKKKWINVADSMGAWLHVMTHPDGEIAFFNDAAQGIAPRPIDLFSYGARMGLDTSFAPHAPFVMLPESGYARLTSRDAVVIADVGPVGPDYLPGHAHADTLSFECSYHDTRLVVNAGTSRYDVTPQRAWQRSTAAHSTVEIGGLNSSEVWGSFRVARRAKPFDISYGESSEGVWLKASHDGYHRLKQKVTHSRTWQLSEKSLEIRDEISPTDLTAIAFFRFYPGWSASESSLTRKDDMVSVSFSNASWTQGVGSYHPEFGLSTPCTVIQAPLKENALTTTFTWKS